MTQDVIALTPEMPDIKTLLAALHAGGPDLRVSQAGGGAVAQLCTDDGQPLVSVEAPRYLQVPGEVERLLGPSARTDAPVWWTEARATTRVEEARRLAGSIAGRLATVLGGTTWPREAAHTDVVTVPTHGDAAATPADVDVLTDRAAVVLQDRPLVAATTWLTDVVRSTLQSGHELHIVTPPGTRLTLPARSVLERIPARWVVRDPDCGYYDGLSGAVLHWHEGHFAPAGDIAPGIAHAFQRPPAPSGERQLHLSLRTIHPADERLLLGGALEHTWQTLTGAPPAGWASAEPVNVPWSPRQLTELARTRARQSMPTWLVVIGAPDRPAIATLRIVRTRLGVEEHISMALGYTVGETVPADRLPEAAETLTTDHNVATMVTELRTAQADLTVPAHHEPPPIPLTLTLGPDALADLGTDHARNALPGAAPLQLGPATRPALHYSLGTGTDPTAWERLRQIDERLRGRSAKG
ncbi:hypothetical protein I2W78_20865 [Streptomyces spinoverrucosus]|uniref:DUF6177 family protein n=1 Tax=Streptomyces spinoverrucosus TaxID=284043 RepID=UPI0018C43A49|nr:DUF6177 family protein [Streptomyces spinoverrucosus]MBG0854219.1 hypothetical protein [Streptomyces spinoverrucosus]